MRCCSKSVWTVKEDGHCVSPLPQCISGLSSRWGSGIGVPNQLLQSTIYLWMRFKLLKIVFWDIGELMTCSNLVRVWCIGICRLGNSDYFIFAASVQFSGWKREVWCLAWHSQTSWFQETRVFIVTSPVFCIGGHSLLNQWILEKMLCA